MEKSEKAEIGFANFPWRLDGKLRGVLVVNKDFWQVRRALTMWDMDALEDGVDEAVEAARRG
jgi:hypothetical protein